MDSPRKTKIGTEVAHVTRDSDTTFKVKGQGHQAALLTTALTRQAAAAVTVGTYWQGSHTSWKVLDFFSLKIPGPGKSWKLKLKVLESPGKIS